MCSHTVVKKDYRAAIRKVGVTKKEILENFRFRGDSFTVRLEKLLESINGPNPGLTLPVWLG